MNAIRFDRLLNVVRALEEAQDMEGKPGFTMDVFFHPCGTPACALGHYAARTDLQSDFRIVGHQLQFRGSWYPYSEGYAHFGFEESLHQMFELFSQEGCGGAKTRSEAAEYIREFIRRHGGEA